jgi:hypothetical protein
MTAQPALDGTALARVRQAWQDRGWIAIAADALDEASARATGSTWARRLGAGSSSRPAWRLVLRPGRPGTPEAAASSSESGATPRAYGQVVAAERELIMSRGRILP